MIKLLTNKENRNFLRLWLAQLISQFGDRIHQLALIGLIAERAASSPMQLAKLMSCTILPVFFIQPFAGVFVDRWNHKIILFICDITRGVLVLLIPLIFIFWKSMIPIYLIVFIVFSFSRFYVPAKMSIIPEIVDKESLLTANSLITTTGMIAAGLGAAFGAFIIEWYGARNGFIIDSMTFILSGVFLINMKTRIKLKDTKSKIIEEGRQIIKKINKSVWSEIKEGFQYIINSKEISFVINILFVLFAAAGAVYVVIIVFIQDAFSSVTRELGIIAIFLVIGLFKGVLVYGKWGKKIPWYKTIFICLIFGGIMLSIFSYFVQLYPNLILACFLALCLGITIGPIFVASNTIVHIVSDEDKRGKVFSALEIVIHLAFLISMLLSSWLAEFVPKALILGTVGIVISFVGIWGLFNTKHLKQIG